MSAEMGVPRHWRMNAARYMGEDRPLFSYSSALVEHHLVDGSHEVIKVRRIESALFGFRLDLVGSGREVLQEIANQFVDGLRNHQLNDQSIQRLAFEVALLDHDLGESFVDEVLKRYQSLEQVSMKDRVVAMKNLGFGPDMAGNWVFKVNGWRRDNLDDLAEVEMMIMEIYEN